MAEEVDKGKAIKLALAIVCLLAAGYLIAASQGWVPAFWSSKPPPAPIKIDEKRQQEFDKEMKEIKENPKQNVPG